MAINPSANQNFGLKTRLFYAAFVLVWVCYQTKNKQSREEEDRMLNAKTHALIEVLVLGSLLDLREPIRDEPTIYKD